MRKIIVAISCILLAAFVIVRFVNAQEGPKTSKKASTEMMDCSKCPSMTSSCTKHADAKEQKCDPSKCRENGCDPAKCKEMGCDPAKCKEGKCSHAGAANTTAAGCGMKCK